MINWIIAIALLLVFLVVFHKVVVKTYHNEYKKFFADNTPVVDEEIDSKAISVAKDTTK